MVDFQSVIWSYILSLVTWTWFFSLKVMKSPHHIPTGSFRAPDWCSSHHGPRDRPQLWNEPWPWWLLCRSHCRAGGLRNGCCHWVSLRHCIRLYYRPAYTSCCPQQHGTCIILPLAEGQAKPKEHDFIMTIIYVLWLVFSLMLFGFSLHLLQRFVPQRFLPD